MEYLAPGQTHLNSCRDSETGRSFFCAEGATYLSPGQRLGDVIIERTALKGRNIRTGTQCFALAAGNLFDRNPGRCPIAANLRAKVVIRGPEGRWKLAGSPIHQPPLFPSASSVAERSGTTGSAPQTDTASEGRRNGGAPTAPSGADVCWVRDPVVALVPRSTAG